MLDGYRTDDETGDALARYLRSGHESIESVASGLPATPDAGEASGVMIRAMSQIADAAGEMSTGMAAASDQAAQTAATYRDAEAANTSDLNR